MRKIKWIDVSSVDTQQCLRDVNEGLEKLGISEKDVISVQRIWSENPAKISPPIGGEDKAYVTLFVFYWAD